MEIALLICGALVLWGLIQRRRGARHARLAEAWRERAFAERELRYDYERALGLPFYSSQAVERDLWTRAHQGDVVSEEVLMQRLSRELETVTPQRLERIG